MGLLDAVIGKYFRDEKVGRVVVFAGDRRNRGYVVDSGAEEARIRSFLKMFHFAEFSILLFGSSLAFAWSTFFSNLQSLGSPEEHVIRTMCIYLVINAILVGVPDWLLRRSYKKSFLSFVSSEQEVVVSGKSAGHQAWTAYATLAVALVILVFVVFHLVRPNSQTPVSGDPETLGGTFVRQKNTLSNN
jgi:hypothetical protein